jgi:hypothetical protein
MRIRGQVEAIDRALEQEIGCADVRVMEEPAEGPREERAHQDRAAIGASLGRAGDREGVLRSQCGRRSPSPCVATCRPPRVAAAQARNGGPGSESEVPDCLFYTDVGLAHSPKTYSTTA